MKIEYSLKDITPKNKAVCIGDLIRYYGETKYKIIESVEKLNNSETTKGMVINLLRKAIDNPYIGNVFDNLVELSKKNIFSFTVDNKNPVIFDNGKNNCNLCIVMDDAYFVTWERRLSDIFELRILVEDKSSSFASSILGSFVNNRNKNEIKKGNS